MRPSNNWSCKTRRAARSSQFHRPYVVGPCRSLTILPELGLDLAFGRLVAELKAQLLIQLVDSLSIDRPAFPLQQHRDPPIAVAHPRLRDLLDPAFERDGLRSLALVMVAGPFRLQRSARPSDADLPGGPQMIHELATPGRP